MAKKGFDLGALAREAMGGNAVSELDTVQSVPAGKIRRNAANFYAMSDIEELASSIELTGLLHPILVKPEAGGDGYVILDGERRFRAMTEVLGEPDIPCIVRRPVNDVIEELMLIEANRTQRRMSAADLSRQAERYTELLAGLRDAGVKIPGRLQDRVAEALDVSASKLKRLHAIRANLEPGLLELFDEGELNESVAYELSRLDYMKQLRVADRFGGPPDPDGALPPVDLRELTAGAVRKLAEEDEAPVSDSDTGNTFDAGAYLAERQAEDDDYSMLLTETADRFLPALSGLNSRQEGILKLKDTFGKHRAGGGSWERNWDAEPRGLTLQSNSRKIRKIFRTWTDVYDMLCTIALHRAATAEPEGDEDENLDLSELDTGAALVHWHRTAPDNMPPEYAPPGSAILLWGDGGLSRTPDSLVKMTISAMPETARWWAVVEGPEEDGDA